MPTSRRIPCGGEAQHASRKMRGVTQRAAYLPESRTRSQLCPHNQSYELQRLVVGEVSLETPPSELETYATLWRLLPYLDDEAVAQLAT